MRNIYYKMVAVCLCCFTRPAVAQGLLDVVTQPLSPAEARFSNADADQQAVSAKWLMGHTAYSHWLHSVTDSASRLPALVYTSLGSGGVGGDFLPYQGNGSTDLRVGGYGEYGSKRAGTLSGQLEYASGKHRGVGWNATRQAEDYLPYLSTDSIGGDYRFRSYRALGRYAFTLGHYVLGVGLGFEGEQAWRLSDPRALNNTTWLRPEVGAAVTLGGTALLLQGGYGRARQHQQLRYWRPGEQDRFFVCYGFGLYDTRQSGVAFGKSRMYYIDEWNADFQATALPGAQTRWQGGLRLSWQKMATEESDIYNLYEARTIRLSPYATVSRDLGAWQLRALAEGDYKRRKGYENIIEEYLIDKDNNIYDFRTLDTQQNYLRTKRAARATVSARRAFGETSFLFQCGGTFIDDKEGYKGGTYRIRTASITPHLRLEMGWRGRRSQLEVALQGQRHFATKHDYNVLLANDAVPHLDFQLAFAPYAYLAADYTELLAKVTYCRRTEWGTVGCSLRGFVIRGHRKADASYTSRPGFVSTAPMITPEPDRHDEQWGGIALFMQF